MLISRSHNWFRLGVEKQLQRCQLRREHHLRARPSPKALRRPPACDKRRRFHAPKFCIHNILSRSALPLLHKYAPYKRFDRHPHSSSVAVRIQRRRLFLLRDSTWTILFHEWQPRGRLLRRLHGQPHENFLFPSNETTTSVRHHLPCILHQRHRGPPAAEPLLERQHVHQPVPRRRAHFLDVSDLDPDEHDRALLPLDVHRDTRLYRHTRRERVVRARAVAVEIQHL